MTHSNLPVPAADEESAVHIDPVRPRQNDAPDQDAPDPREPNDEDEEE
jgi:hypothetical protein